MHYKKHFLARRHKKQITAHKPINLRSKRQNHVSFDHPHKLNAVPIHTLNPGRFWSPTLKSRMFRPLTQTPSKSIPTLNPSHYLTAPKLQAKSDPHTHTTVTPYTETTGITGTHPKTKPVLTPTQNRVNPNPHTRTKSFLTSTKKQDQLWPLHWHTVHFDSPHWKQVNSNHTHHPSLFWRPHETQVIWNCVHNNQVNFEHTPKTHLNRYSR